MCFLFNTLSNPTNIFSKLFVGFVSVLVYVLNFLKFVFGFYTNIKKKKV